jgi:hypothetical protein
MPNKKFINELKKLLRKRGKASNVQMEYAKVEENALRQMYPVTTPSEEERSPNLRNLKSYLGEQAFNKIVEGRRDIVPLSIRV